MNRYVDEKGYSSFKTIKNNETHFRLCNKCRSFNYYRNSKCVLCNSSNLDKSFEYDSNTYKEIFKEYKFYTDNNFDITDIDNIKISTVAKEKIRDRDKNFKLNQYLFKSKNNNTIVVN